MILILEEMVNESSADGKSQKGKKTPNAHRMEIHLHALVQLWKAFLHTAAILKRQMGQNNTRSGCFYK